jgi:hypothetical protein
LIIFQEIERSYQEVNRVIDAMTDEEAIQKSQELTAMYNQITEKLKTFN